MTDLRIRDWKSCESIFEGGCSEVHFDWFAKLEADGARLKADIYFSSHGYQLFGSHGQQIYSESIYYF